MEVMNITYNKQRAPGSPSHSLGYQVDGDVLTVAHRTYKFAEGGSLVDVETVDTFDFSGLPPGAVVEVSGIETNLPVQPIREARRDDAGEMHVTLLDWGDGRG